MPWPAQVIAYALCSVFVGVGLMILIFSGFSVVEGYRATSWPSTEGEIVDSELVDKSDSESTSVELKVHYRYRVGGEEHVGTRIHPSYGGTSDLKSHHALRDALPAKARVMVRYDPDSPARSTLATGFYSGSLIGACCGLIFFVMGALFALIVAVASYGNTDYARGIEVIQAAPR